MSLPSGPDGQRWLILGRWLIFPALFGTVIFVLQVSLAPETLDSDVIFIYMILISAWATLFLERWLRKQNTLAHLWGVMHIETEDILRREFVGEPRYNHVSLPPALASFDLV